MKTHPTNPAAVWAPRDDGNGFHWTVNAPADAPEPVAVAKPAVKRGKKDMGK